MIINQKFYLRNWDSHLNVKENIIMAKKSMKVKANKKQKFKVREYNRCPITGRARGFIRKFGMSRNAFRKLASEGLIPGVRKASL